MSTETAAAGPGGLIGAMSAADVDRITSTFFIEGPLRHRTLATFWTMLVLSAIIAASGIVGDSTATVIGAMIVAPLMRPILGTACAIVLARRNQVMINLALIVAGAAVVIAIGYLLGLLNPIDVVADNNSQVAARVSPKLIDLVSALATGTVGAYAIVRYDVSDSLPGVAIAISLVPPLAVVGLTLEAGAGDQALGALLLFGTNVAAIIATGIVVLLIARFREATRFYGGQVGRLTGRTLLVVIASVVIVAVPLAVGSQQVFSQQATINAAKPVAERWAASQDWTLTDVFMRSGVLHVVAIGHEPEATTGSLRQALDRAGLEDVEADVTLVLGGTTDLPASSE